MAAKVTRFALVYQGKFTEDENGNKSYSETYIAETSELAGAFLAIRRHRPDLQRWQPCKQDPTCFVQRFSIDQRKHSLIFDITVDYGNQTEEDDDPTARPAEVEAETSTIQVPVLRDANGQFLTNTAGRLIEGVTQDATILTFSIKKFISSWPDWIYSYDQATNSDSVMIRGKSCAPRTLKVTRLHIGTDQVQNDISFAEFSATIQYNPNTWDNVYLNRGMEELVLVPKKHPKKPGKWLPVWQLQACTDRHGQPVTEQAFLDIYGRQPRIHPETKKLLTLQEELQAAEKGIQLARQCVLKHPLDNEDIVLLKKQQLIPKPFSILPVR